MSTLEAGTIEPQSGTTVTLGASGDSVVIGADALKVNTIKDAGANTIFTSDGSGTLSSVNSALAGNMVFISSATASGDASLSFTSGIDSTYDEYVFYFVNIHPATNNTHFTFQIGSGYNTTMTTTFFNAYNAESGGTGVLAYDAGHDQAQGTAYQTIGMQLGNLSDESGSGELHLFAPSSTTYVKHFYSRFQQQLHSEYSFDEYMAGYGNTTSAITQIDFKMSSGNIDAGTIALYGIK